MSETPAEIPMISEADKTIRKQLMDAVDKTMERTFAEEVEYFEELGGDSYLMEKLGVSFECGVNASDIDERRRRFGSNEREEKPTKGYCTILWETLGDFTLRVLTVAAVLSIILNTATADAEERPIAWIEGFAILVAVMISSNVQAVNDYQKEKQFKKLNAVSEERKVLDVWRDEKIQKIHQSQLVVGDVVKIQEGSDIPADGYVIEASEVSTDESAMTGETDPIVKNSLHECLNKRSQLEEEGSRNTAGHHDVYSPILLAGTKILAGEGKYVVIIVGKDSSIGKIKELLGQDDEATPLQQKLEKIAGDIGKFGLISAILTLIVLIIRFIVDMSINDTWNEGSEWKALLDYVILAITVVVVAIPEGLPLAVTLSLAYSVKRMLKDENLVKKLQACETMGGASNICSDKTGTLTQNKMNLTRFWNGKFIDIDTYKSDQNISSYISTENGQELLKQALVCNSSATLDPESGSKTEIALLKFADKLSIPIGQMQKKHLPSAATKFPFTSKRKRMSTVLENVETGVLSNKRMHLKGASEFILSSCNQLHLLNEDKIVPITSELRKEIAGYIKEMADGALRTICIGYKDLVGGEDMTTKDDKDVAAVEKEGFILLGVLGIRDILRQEVKGAVKQCQRAGIKVRMVTGDNRDTARAIAKECGIIDPGSSECSISDTSKSEVQGFKEGEKNSLVLEGNDFQKWIGDVVCKHCGTKECGCARDKATAEKDKKKLREDVIQNIDNLAKIAPCLDVLARSRPEDKYALVTGLRQLGYVIAVTGDGTNDAAALKKADVGFAMGVAGTEVAREAADIVLLDDNFSSIVKAVQWGRNIYDSIKKFLQFQLTVNVVAVLLTLIGSAIYKMAVLTPVQMLWVNLIMDTLASLALATESPSPILLERPPHHKTEYILSKKMIKFITFHSIYQTIVILIMTIVGERFIPEYGDIEAEDYYNHDGISTPVKYSEYGGGSKYVVSGRLYHANGDPSYEHYEVDIGPSRHFTVVFNTFVFLQIFNFLNARKLQDEINIMEGILDSPMFIGIVIVITGLQILLGMVGGRPLHVHRNGTHIIQWIIAVAFGAGEILVGIFSKFVPDRIFPTFGKEQRDPLNNPSVATSIKRSLERRRSNSRRYTGSFKGDDGKAGSLSHKLPPPN